MTSSEATQQARELLDLMRREAALLKSLGGVMEQKREALVESDIESIEQLAEQEQEVGRELSTVEEERCNLFKEVALQLTPYLQDPTLDEFVAALIDDRPDLGERFAQVGEELRERVTEAGQLNFDNLVLTRNLIDYTQTLLDMIARGGTSPNYSDSGQTDGEPDQPRRLMDRQV